MGVRRQIVKERVYTVVDDITSSYRAVFTSALLDELTGAPVRAIVSLRADLPRISMRQADGALIAGAAYPELVLPDLATQAYSVHVLAIAPGYRDASLTVNIPAGSSLPVAIAPLIMRRTPVRLQGRVVKVSDRSPIGSATVFGTDHKHLLLRTPLRFSHAGGITVNAISLSNTGPVRKLKKAATRGAIQIVVDNSGGLGPGYHLQLGSEIAAEIYEVNVIGPDPGEVQLTAVIASSFAQDTPVQQVTAAGPTGMSTLARSADVGDGSLVVFSALNDSGVEVSDGAATELHWLNAISGSDGYYRVNAVAGIRSMEVSCSAASFTTAVQSWFPEYSDPINVIDFRLKP